MISLLRGVCVVGNGLSGRCSRAAAVNIEMNVGICLIPD